MPLINTAKRGEEREVKATEEELTLYLRIKKKYK